MTLQGRFSCKFTRWGWCITSLLLLVAACATAKTFPGTSDPTAAPQQQWGTVMQGYVVSGCTHATSADTEVSITSCIAFALDTAGVDTLKGFEDSTARTVTYSGGDGTYWLLGRANPSVTPAGWTCVAGTPYCWILNASKPALPSGTLLLQRSTVAGSAVTAVAPQFMAGSPLAPGHYEATEYLTYHGGICDGLTDISAALTAAMAALPANGGRIILPANTESTACILASTFDPSKMVHLVGQGANIVNGTNRNQTHITYTGSGVGILLDAVGNTNSILEGFLLRNDGTGTVGIEVSTGGVLLRRLNLFGGTDWTVAGIRVGGLSNAVDTVIEDVHLRAIAPICVSLDNIGAHVVLDHVRATDCTVANLTTGTDTFTVQSLTVRNSTFEAVPGAFAIQINRCQACSFYNNYFEPRDLGEGTINIPSTALRADGLLFEGNFFGWAATTTHAINVSFTLTFATFRNNYHIGDLSGGTSMIVNTGTGPGLLISEGEFMNSGTLPIFSNAGNTLVRAATARGTGITEGWPLHRFCTNTTAAGNVDAAETTTHTCSLPGNTLWVNGMSVRLLAQGRTATNANTKRVKLYIKSIAILDTGAIAASNVDWVIHAECTYHNSGEANCITWGDYGGARVAPNSIRVTLGGTGWAGTFALDLTATATTTNDVIVERMFVQQGF